MFFRGISWELDKEALKLFLCLLREANKEKQLWLTRSCGELFSLCLPVSPIETWDENGCLRATEEIAMKGSWRITTAASVLSKRSKLVCSEISSEELVEKHLTRPSFHPVRCYCLILTSCIGMNWLLYLTESNLGQGHLVLRMNQRIWE